MSDEKFNNGNNPQDDIVFIDFEQVEEVSRVFFEESKEILEDLDQNILRLEQAPDDIEQINILFRKVHTLKGSVGAVPGGQLLGSLAHEFEALLNRIKRESRSVDKGCIDVFLKSSRILKLLAGALRDKREVFPEELSEAIELISFYGGFEFSDDVPKKTVAVARPQNAPTDDPGVWMSMSQMNEFLRLSGELLVLKNFFQMMNQTVNFRTDADVFERRQADFAQNLGKISDQFQSQVQTVRKEKAQESFSGLPLLIRQASTELNKSVHFELEGGELLIDKGLGQDLYDCLVHLVRNSIDHGIEDQFERALQGKGSLGTLVLHIEERNGHIEMSFKDDGKGLDKDLIVKKAIKSGLVQADEIAAMSDNQIYNLIFHAGFSTKDKVTTISGRGVGMDIVRSTIDKYQGRIDIETTLHQGTCFKFIVPIPQHIMVESALLCSWNNFQVAVPLKSVAHISSCNEVLTTTVNKLRYCQFQNITVPLLNYAEYLSVSNVIDDEKLRNSSAVYIRASNQVIALVVDKVEAQTDLVVKGFGDIIKAQKGFKGVSILADEKITYVLDPDKLMEVLTAATTASEEAA